MPYWSLASRLPAQAKELVGVIGPTLSAAAQDGDGDRALGGELKLKVT